jgi:hypothetical protein
VDKSIRTLLEWRSDLLDWDQRPAPSSGNGDEFVSAHRKPNRNVEMPTGNPPPPDSGPIRVPSDEEHGPPVEMPRDQPTSPDDQPDAPAPEKPEEPIRLL